MQNSQSHRVIAVYQPSTIPAYQGNPLIEALPPLNSFVDDLSALKGKLRCTPDDIHQNGVDRAHSICRVIDDFFQPRFWFCVCIVLGRSTSLDRSSPVLTASSEAFVIR